MTEQEIVKESVLGALGVDWKIFIAQLINFSVVLFVLRKWVYVPLLKAMESRSERIDKGLKDAEAAAAAVKNAEAQYEKALVDARKESQRILEEATANSEKLAADMKTKAKAEVAKIVEEGRTLLADEKEKMVQAARKDIADVALAAAEQVLRETMDDKHQKAMLDAAVKKIVS